MVLWNNIILFFPGRFYNVYYMGSIRKKIILYTAELMCTAARTAEKARSIDKIVTGIITGDEKDLISKKCVNYLRK